MMALAETFQQIVDSLPDDWTDLELDLRIFDERRYVDAAVLLVTCNAQPYSKNDWHWRLLVAHRFGHAASAPAVHTALHLLDEAGIDGEMAVREARTGPRRGEPDVGTDRVRARRVQADPRPVGARSRRSTTWRESSRSSPICCSARTWSARSRPAGHEPVLVPDVDSVSRELPGAQALIVDLTADAARAARAARGDPVRRRQDARVLLARRGGRASAGRAGRLRPGRPALADGARGRRPGRPACSSPRRLGHGHALEHDRPERRVELGGLRNARRGDRVHHLRDAVRVDRRRADRAGARRERTRRTCTPLAWP